MKFDQYNVKNYDKFGELLKKWADDKTSRPPEGPIVELEKAMTAADVGFSFVPGRIYTTFKFVETTQPGGDVLMIVVPVKEITEAAAKDLDDNAYQLPDFYEEAFGEPLTIPKAKRKAFHTQRIAEYVMKWCG